MFNDMPVQKTKKQPSIIDLANATYSMTASSSSQQSSLLNRQQNNTSNGSGNSKGRSIIKNGKSGSRSFSSMSSTTKNSVDDRLDAARAMLGISPCSVIDESVTTIMGGRGGPGNNNSNNSKSSLLQQEQDQEAEEASVVITTNTNDDPNSSGRSRSRSNSAGLDALAFYATREQEATVASTTMIMPSILLEGNSDLTSGDFGRFIGSHNSDNQISSSSHNNNNKAAAATSTGVVPPNPVTSSSDDDSEIMPPPPPRTTYINTNNNTRMSRRRSVSNPEIMDKWDTKRLRLVLPASILEEEIAEAEAAILIAKKEKSLATTTDGGGSSCNNYDEEDDDESDSSSTPPTMVDEEEENLDHDQLLRRARSRLLEDLSIASGEKGVLTLPHSLKKYKEVRTIMYIRLPTYLLFVCTFVLK
jgi:hypothetical protein